MAIIGKPVRIGIELGARTLKVAWVMQRGRTAQWQYREHRRSDPQRPETLAQDLARLLHPLRRHRAGAHTVVAAPNSYIHRLTVQAPDAKRLPAAVRERLPSILPFDANQAQVRFMVQRQERAQAQSAFLLSVAACESSALQADLEALWRNGWAPSAVVPSALALLNAAGALQRLDEGAAVLMDVGERRTTIVLIEQRVVVYARDVALGMDHLVEALMGQVTVGERTVSLSWDQAETLLKEVGIPSVQNGAAVGWQRIPVATYLAMIQPIVEQLVSELRRTMAFGAQMLATSAPQRLLVSGAGCCLPHVEGWLSAQLTVPVTVMGGEPWLGEGAAACAVPCGLALLEQGPALDLLPAGSRRRGTIVRAARRLRQVLVVVAAAVWLGVGWWQWHHRGIAQELGELEGRWVALQPVVALHGALEDSAQLLRRLGVGEGVSLEWFDRLAGEFPAAVRLTRLGVGAGPGPSSTTAGTGRHVSLAGEAQEREQTAEAAVSGLPLWLERTRLCQGVQLGSTQRMNAAGTVISFSLTCQLP